ncbi:hypothetical protein KNU02_gp87 [Gordonia phage Pleakley]|uniref:Uncharacterized protein n=1 Tax=Gordonia phage Pleakley TaxID=2283246 RepID=A0A345M6K5_9CAUD|nr:hypothetical protein KNU02_gp87 [Gordonia phage Pleakley]AXH49812.1 hypothetical protein SEA_FURY_87 [Gordonia phage Fury]AXH66126.1 hypothetical protein SEA_PLEAKLEY_87 [Gordonia phage Pleakley]
MAYRNVYNHTSADYRAEALERLRKIFPPKSTATTIVRHVTASGMGRSISVLAPTGDPATDRYPIMDVSGDVARVLGWKIDNDRGGVYVQGCGMDMTFHLVYSLARALYADVLSDSERRALAGPHGSADAGYLINNRSI